MTSAGFDSTEIGFIKPGGGDGAVDTVNGVAPIGGDVSLTAADIPSTGPSDVQADLDKVRGLIVIDGITALEREFSAVSGVHTIDKQTVWVSPLGVLIDLPAGNSISVVHPGSISGLSSSKVTIAGDVAAALLDGELALADIAVKNVNAGGMDVRCESLSGRTIRFENVDLLGQNPGTFENILGVGIFKLSLHPSASGASGIVLDGVNGAMLWHVCDAAPQPGGAYAAWTIAATAIISVLVRFDTIAIFGEATQSLLFIDPAATLPAGPLPTNIAGCEVFGCGVKGESSLFAAGSIGHTDIRVLSIDNPGGPTSAFIGDARANTTATAAPVPIVQTYVAANTFEVVPTSNGAIAPNDVDLVLNTALSQRHSVQVVSGKNVLRYDGPLDGQISTVSWKALVDRTGGPATVDIELEFDSGGGRCP